MNYKFPIIETIDDVLPHIEGREEFRIFDKEWYKVINYMVNLEDSFPSVVVSGGSAKMREERSLTHRMRRECRGLIFDVNGKLISRPYHKFFNVGEKEETQLNKVNLYEPHVVLEKLDGSMIRPIPTADGFRLATKAGVTDVSMNAEVFIADKLNYSLFIKKCIQKGTTPIFEWCSRKNRIVVDYPEDQLILTGIRYTNTGEYVVHDVMKRYAEAWGIPVVKAFALNKGGKIDDRIEDMVEHIRKWEGTEGVVLRFDSGQMLKIKSEDYILRHRSKDAINQEKNVIQVLLDDATDDLIPLLTPEDADRIKRFQRAFHASLEEVASDLYDQYQSLNKKGTQKDFALIVQKQVPKHLHHFMFGAYRGESMKDLLIKSISKSLSTQTKVDSARWMWNNLDWNYSDK
jgi:RNA ligase